MQPIPTVSLRIRFLQAWPVVLDYAGITYLVLPHRALRYIAVFFGEEGGHFKISDTFETPEHAEKAFSEGFAARLQGPTETLMEELFRRGIAEHA